MKEYTKMWEQNIHTISKTAEKYPQEIYAAVVRWIQSEWIFPQYVTKNMGDSFQGVEKMFRESFCLCLFFRKSKSLSPIVGKLRTIPVKKAVLGLLNPVTYVNEKYLGLQHTSTDLIQSMMGEGACSNVDHLLVLR